MREVEDLPSVLASWYESHQSVLAGHGGSVRFGRSPADRLKTSAWVTAERSGRMVSLQVWSGGEVEFETGGYDRVDMQEHHELNDASELDLLLCRLIEFLDG